MYLRENQLIKTDDWLEVSLQQQTWQPITAKDSLGAAMPSVQTAADAAVTLSGASSDPDQSS